MPDEASRTAVLVCQGRAVAHGRLAVGRFDDPTAMGLLREDERRPVEQVRSGVAPNAWRDRIEYEMLRANAEVMVPRTVGIDDAVSERPTAQVVILGAGLDGRAWRMPGLSAVEVARVLSGRSAPGSRLVVNYQAPALSATAGRRLAGVLAALAGRADPVANERQRSSWTPAAMSALLAGQSFVVVRDDDLLTIAERLRIPVRNRRSLRVGHIAVADR
jgi:O-methyltransferase involved in polyketide biosynthesis